MNKFLSILFFITISMTFQAQTFCLQLQEVSNDGTNLVVSLDAQGSEAFNLGSANLQFLTSEGAFGTPTMVSTTLAPPTYFIPTVTQPNPGSYSLNIELVFPGLSMEIAATPAFSNLAVISFPILDAALANEGLSWQFNGGTTETVIFLDDEATQIFATSTDCLQGIDPVLPPVGADQCAGALAIEEGIYTNAGPSIGDAATNACFTGAINATWYSYTATISGLVTISSSIDLDQPDTRVSVHSSCETLDCLASDDDGGEGFTSIATLDVIAGTTYIIEWDDRWDDGEFDFEISVDDGSVDCEELGLNVGDACDDLDASTENDIVLDNCTCIGTTIVFDCPELLANFGDACDDLDETTENDLITNACVCAGTGLPDDAVNALCENAIGIGEGTILAADISGGAGASNICFGAGGTNAIWYAYTASANGVATVSSSIDLDTPDTRVSVYTGPCDDLTCLTSDDDAGEGFTSLTSFDATGGTTYLVEWDDRWDDGEFDFEVSLVPDVVDAGCTDATACNFDPTATEDDGSCLLATGCDVCDGEGGIIDNLEIGDACDDGDEATINDILADCAGTCIGEPIIVAPNALCADAIAIGEGTILAADISGGAGASNLCFGTGGTNAIWYAYTASADGVATVSSSIDLDTPDTRVSVYTGPCDDLTCLASDDDGGEGFTSLTSFDATSGTTYLVEWDDRWDDGEFDFEISLEPTVEEFDCPELEANFGDACDDLDETTENDSVTEICTCVGTPIEVIAENALCADAIAIGEGTILAADIIGGAGASNLCFGTGGTNALWYAYTASADGVATVSSSIDLDTPDTRVSVYTGPCDDLTCLTSDDDAGEGFTSLTSFDATGGTTYLVEWDDRWDDGEFDFEISLEVIEPILGCTDAAACNFDLLANQEDESCVFAEGCDECDELGGVIDNPEIGDACDDGQVETINDIYINCNVCLGFVPECFDPSACNFSGNPPGIDHPSTDKGDDGFCIYATGCDECDGLGGVTDNPEIGDACDDGDVTTSNDVLTACDVCEGTPGPIAENALCADAIDIGEGIVLAADINGGAGASNLCFGAGGTNALWYAYTASADGVATVSSSIDLDTPDTRVSVYTGPCDDLTCLTSDDDAGEGFTSLTSFDATGGTTYLVEWDDRWDDGEFDFEISLEPTVEEFDCPELEADFGDACDDLDETTENDMITEACACAGTPIVEEFDCPELEADFGDACDDLDETTENDMITEECTCAGTPVEVIAENALCADAIAIGEGIVLAADIQGGAGATNACFGSATNALYYAYTASADGVATVSSSIDLDQPDTRVSIHASCDVLNCIASDDDGGEGFTTIALFDVTAGTTYIVEWDDRWDDGEFDFEISLEPTVEPVPGCVDEAACNYNPDATFNDDTCDFGSWYIPAVVNAGPAILACESPEGYLLADQECIIEIISNDPFCVETTFDQLCLDTYLECTGEVFECEEISNNIWGIGLFVTGGTQYTFVAENANDAILVQGPGNVSIEVFAGECGGESLGVFDNYGEGEVERAVPGGLIPGNTYSYFIAGENPDAIISKVKTYAVTTIKANLCNTTMELIDQIFCSREEDMYPNPVVNVVGFGFRFVNQANGDEILVQDGTVDGFYQQLSTIGGFELGATYDVSARHQVIQSANGSVMSLWSDYGPTCPITIEAQIPLTNVRDEYCGGVSSFNLGDLIKAYPVVGADMYEWTFDNGVDVITYQTVGYPVYLYQIAGLQYGQAYNVRVRAHLNGNWGEFGSTCTILMDSQPESTKVRDTHCGLDYTYPSVELLYADFVGAATEYTWEFSNGVDVLEFTSANYKLLMYQPGLATGVYDVRVKAFAGGVYSDYAASCSITLNGGGDLANGQDIDLLDKSIAIATSEATVYPNPNTGDMVYLNIVNLDTVDSDVVISVTNMFGKLILSEQVTSNGNSFNHELKLNQNLPVGMYMIQIQIGNQLLVEKLIVE